MRGVKFERQAASGKTLRLASLRYGEDANNTLRKCFSETLVTKILRLGNLFWGKNKTKLFAKYAMLTYLILTQPDILITDAFYTVFPCVFYFLDTKWRLFMWNWGTVTRFYSVCCAFIQRNVLCGVSIQMLLPQPAAGGSKSGENGSLWRRYGNCFLRLSCHRWRAAHAHKHTNRC